MKERLFYIAYLAAGFFCLAALAISKEPVLAEHFQRDDPNRYGDLYNMCKVNLFKADKRIEPKLLEPPLNLEVKIKNVSEHDIEDADIIFMGDSFFEKYFGTAFEKYTGTRAYSHKIAAMESPVDILKSLNYKKNNRVKFLVYENVERNLLPLKLNEQAGLNSFDRKIKRIMPAGDSLEFLIEENPLILHLMSLRNNMRFIYFDEISNMTPLYSTEPPMLFYKYDIEFNRMKKEDEDIRSLVNKIEEYQVLLKRNYGLTLVFMPVPDKYTVYGYRKRNGPDEAYDNLLPRLYAELGKNNIKYVPLYYDFLKTKGLLYWPSDTHWNKNGIDIAILKLLESLEGVSAGQATGGSSALNSVGQERNQVKKPGGLI